jgi:hypothetical protein
MKKIVISILLIALTGISQTAAQSTTDTAKQYSVFNMSEKISWDIVGGVNISTMKTRVSFDDLNNRGISVAGKKQGTKPVTTYHAGAMFNLPVLRRLYLHSGLILTGKGGTDNTGVAMKSVFLQCPLMVSYKYPVSKNIALAVKGGYYYMFRTGGDKVWQHEVEVTNANGVSSLDTPVSELPFGGMGGIFAPSIHLKRLYLEFQYDIGGMNSTGYSYVMSDGGLTTILTIQTFSFRLGYKF